MIDAEKEELAAKLRGSLLEFMRFFCKLLTKRDFIVSNPPGRESHHIELCRAYTRLLREPRNHYGLITNIPPGYGKSFMTSMFVAWAYAHYPDCNFLYISYSASTATKHTGFIKDIMSCAAYKYLFDVHLRTDSKAKDNFKTTQLGEIRAYGSGGSITGMDAGLPGLDRFSGAVIYDDAHKPDEVHSDLIRETVKRNYNETVLQRFRGENVPCIFTGQRLHEDDLPAYLLSGKDVRSWDSLILPGLDAVGNALYPEKESSEYLLAMKEKQPYVFASQIQQDPVASGSGLFQRAWFVELINEPEILTSFITVDSAETTQSYNDATVFSFFGIYKLEGAPNNQVGLHWIDCVELRVEPCDLEDALLDFYGDCSRHKRPPSIIAIEKKSTGVTLVSSVKKLRGVTVREIDRTRASGSKTQRFLDIQPIIASKFVSIGEDAKHKEMVLTHMTKITANNTHRHDDIADTLSDGIRMVYFDKTVYYVNKDVDTTSVAFKINQQASQLNKLRMSRYG